jgi:hypothetical protein
VNWEECPKVQIRQAIFLLVLATVSAIAQSQESANAPSDLVPSGAFGDASGSSVVSGSVLPQQTYVYAQPSETTKLHNALLDSFGPYPLAMALLTAGIHQATDNPPDWHQGMAGFGDRFASNMGITIVDNATRYGLGEVLKEDTSYYRCRCTGVFVRLKHATVSTLIARKSDDGHSVFSIPGVAAPYVAATTAVYGWYPSRYDAKDAFRMGNYNLLGYVASNLTFEFVPSKPGSFLGRMHLTSRRATFTPDYQP